MSKWCAALLMFLTAVSAASAAVRMNDLYEAGVDVSSQGKAERVAALREALREVITRVSGTQNLGGNPSLGQALDQASRYVQQYRYRVNPTAPGQASSPGLRLWVRFDSRLVDRMLHDGGLPIWGRERPTTLVWLAVDGGQQRMILGADGNDDIRGELEIEAKRRGMPLMFPIMDLEDQSRLRFADLWGGFADAIRAASARYNPEAILVGRLFQESNGNWNARWTLYNQGQDAHWASDGSDRAQVFAFGIDSAADTLASRYAMRAGQESNTPVTLTVTGVNNLQDYVRLSKYLSSLTFVLKTNVIRVDGSRITYALQIQGDPAGLTQTFALGNTVAPASAYEQVPGSAGAGSDAQAPTIAAGELTYRLLP